jgi:hypothetical protein
MLDIPPGNHQRTRDNGVPGTHFIRCDMTRSGGPVPSLLGLAAGRELAIQSGDAWNQWILKLRLTMEASRRLCDHGRGELSDATSALDWAMPSTPEAKRGWIAPKLPEPDQGSEPIS